MAALAICAVTAAQLKDRTDAQAPRPIRPGQPPPAEPGMIPLTILEIERLLAALTMRLLPRRLVAHGTHGPAATKPVRYGTTNAPDSSATSNLPRQPAECGCRTSLPLRSIRRRRRIAHFEQPIRPAGRR